MGASFALTAAVVVAWYTSNIGVLLLNKYLLSNTGFKQPVFLTLCHMMACATLGYCLSLGKFTPIKPLKSKKQMWKICVLSTIFCATIVLGNMSLKYIPISFNQAIGATTPLFTAFFALVMQGTKESAITYSTLVPIAGGVVIASGGEPLFNLIGFIACLMATAGRALKSVVQSMILTDNTEKLDAMSLLFYMSSFSVLLLLPMTTLLEPTSFGIVHSMIESKPGFFWWLLGNSCMAYAVNLTNFLVTKYTSALTLQVLGNLKGVIAVIVSVALFRNPVTVKGCVGYMITVLGVILYSEAKKRTKLVIPVKLAESPKSVDIEAAEPLIKAQPGNGGPPMAAGGVMSQGSQGGMHPTNRTVRGSTPGTHS